MIFEVSNLHLKAYYTSLQPWNSPISVCPFLAGQVEMTKAKSP